MSDTKTRSPKGLGKGLSALIAEINEEAPRGSLTLSEQATTELPVNRIDPSPYQPRKYFAEEALRELADSVRKNGVMQPIIVREREGRYELIAGERRWRASKLAGLQTIPVIVKDLSDRQALEFALIENIQRQDLTPIEEAQGYRRIMNEFNYTQEELSAELGKSRSHVANMLRLLALPDRIKHVLDEGQISMGHARALIGVEDAPEMVEEIIRKQLNVRQTEKLIKDRTKPATTSPSPTAPRQAKPVANVLPKEKDEDILGLERMLSEAMGLAVSIEDEDNNGRVVIAFNSLEQLDRILQKLGR